MGKTAKQYSEDDDKKLISLTAFRAMYIAKLLSLKDLSTEEIIEALSKNEILSKSCHKDTIINSINSLRETGFDIEKPKPSNNFKYKLLFSPIKFQLNESETELLNTLRESLYFQNDYNILIKLTEAYDNIIANSQNNENIDKLISSNYLQNIDKKILNQLLEICLNKTPAGIIYNSPKYGLEELKIFPQQIVFENKKIYLWVYNYKYDMPAYLRVDKISQVNTNIGAFNPETPIKLSTTVEYELRGNAMKNFIPLKNEIVTEKLIDKITVKAEVINTFNFIQRASAFADECKIIKPESIKETFLKQIDQLIKVYDEN